MIDLYNQGYHCVVDLDLKAYFDTVNHDLMMKLASQYVQDPWLLKLIRRFLTSGVMNGRVFEHVVKGIPQGRTLVSIIYLNERKAGGHWADKYVQNSPANPDCLSY